MNFEKFSLYGFSIDYPDKWEFEINPKSRRKGGDLVFKSEQGMKIFFSWGELDLAKTKYGTLGEHSKCSLRRLEKIRGVKSIEIVSKENRQQNEHEIIIYHIIANIYSKLAYALFSKPDTRREVRFAQVHCDESKRYFSIYGSAPPEMSSDQLNIFNQMVQSLKCH